MKAKSFSKAGRRGRRPLRSAGGGVYNGADARRERVSVLPKIAAISMPPPGVNSLPERATRRGKRSCPFLMPSCSTN